MRTVQPSAKVCAMRRNLGFAAAFALLLALAAPVAEAQKSGGILIMSHFDSPASMSMHEEATGAVHVLAHSSLMRARRNSREPRNALSIP